jgi:desulfoferrodoxin (superoxide reductase-like protein)
MKTRRLRFGLVVFIFFCMMNTGVALADKSAVRIEAQDAVAKGTEVTIKLHVTHNGNNLFHHTNWVKAQANGKEIARWDYSATNLPEGGNFTKEIKLTVNEALEIVAESNCNVHGSAGPATKKISVR